MSSSSTHLPFIKCAQNYAATAGAVLELFGYEKLFKETNGAGIHRLENLLTLTSDIHERFNALALWLEPVVCSLHLWLSPMKLEADSDL